MGSAREGLRLHARKSSPCALTTPQIRRFYACWASLFAPSGPAPVLEVTRRTSGGCDGGFAPCEAFLRRVAGVSHPCMAQFPQIGGGAAAVRGSVAPKTQTTSMKNAENGLLIAKWSAFWAVPGGMGCSRTLSGAWPEWLRAHRGAHCRVPGQGGSDPTATLCVRTLTPECARKPLDTHANPLCGVWAGLPRLA